MKKCLSKAHEGDNPLPETEFYKNRSEEDGLADYCKVCSRRAVKQTNEKKPPKAKTRVLYSEQERKIRRKHSFLERKYKLTVEEVESMYQSQNGKCAICSDPLGHDIKDPNPFCVDHDHNTNKVRGLLCRECNSGLGKFRDNIAHLQQAIQYLREFE